MTDERFSTATDLADYLTDRGAHDVSGKQVTSWGISANTPRGFIGDRPVMATAGTWSPGDRLCSVADLLAWMIQDPAVNGATSADLYLAYGPGHQEVLDGLRLMRSLVQTPYQISLWVEDSPGALHFHEDREGPRSFPPGGKDESWYAALEQRYRERRSRLARKLIELTGDWRMALYPPNVSDATGTWRIRLDGLEVGSVVVNPDGTEAGVLIIGGQDSSNHKAVKAWNATGAQGPQAFDDDTVHAAAERVRRLIETLGTIPGTDWIDHGSPEHTLEARILQGQIRLTSAEGGSMGAAMPRAADGVVYASQLPTLWTPAGKPRYLDGLLVDENGVPVAVEMKVIGGSGSGRYLRKALHQAALYAHYLTHSSAARTFIASQMNVSTATVRPAVYWPQAGSGASPTQQCHEAVARILGIAVLTGKFDPETTKSL